MTLPKQRPPFGIDILEALVESNHQRQKTNGQFGREAAVMLEVEHERAKRRMASSLGSRIRR